MRNPFKNRPAWIGNLQGLQAMSYDSQIQDYFTRLASAGGTMTTAHKNALQILKNTLLSVNGVNEWAKIKELCIFKGGTLASSYVKTVFTATYPSSLTGTNMVSGDYSDVSGVRGNGTNKVLDTGTSYKTLLDYTNYHLLTFGDHFLQEPGSFAAQVFGGTASVWEFGNLFVLNGVAMGWQSILGGASGDKAFWSSTYQVNRSLHLLNASSATLGTMYNNNPAVSFTNAATRTTWASTNTIALLGQNNISWCSNSAISMYSVGAAFVDSNVSAIYAAFKAFFAAIGRGFGKKIVWHGDSITAAGSTYTMHTQRYLDTNTTSANYGHPGWGITPIGGGVLYLPSVAGELDADLGPNSIYSYAGGTNDLGNNADPTVMFNKLVDNINYVKARGVTQIVIMTVAARAQSSSWTWTTAMEANRISYNTMVRNNAATYGYIVADVGGSANLGNPAVVDTTYYNADLLHWNENGHIYAGMQVFGPAIRTAGFA